MGQSRRPLKWWEETNDEDTDADDDDDEDDFDEEEFAATSSVVVIVIPTPTKWRWTQTQPETFLCWLWRQFLYAVLLSGIFSDRVIFGYSLRSKKNIKNSPHRETADVNTPN